MLIFAAQNIKQSFDNDLSLAIGEISLFGPIRRNPQAIVAATGISCRQQIRDGTGRTAVHPIELFMNGIR